MELPSVQSEMLASVLESKTKMILFQTKTKLTALYLATRFCMCAHIHRKGLFVMTYVIMSISGYMTLK